MDDDCTEVFPTGTVVELRATPSPDGRFGGWSGACTGDAVTCSVTVSGATDVVATFEPLAPPLALGKAWQLSSDVNSNGTVSPGDGLGYSPLVVNTSGSAVTNLTLKDRVGVPQIAEDGAKRSAALVVGSVTTTSGTTQGNSAGDADVVVTIPTFPAHGVLLVRYHATARPTLYSVRGIDVGPAVWNGATVSGDPGGTVGLGSAPTQSGPCSGLAQLLGGICINADAGS